MAFFFNDYVHTKSFTPREHQVELFYSARESNIIICLGKSSEQTFIAIKLIQEAALNNRKSLACKGKRTIYLFEDESLCAIKAVHIEQLTDLKVLQCTDAKNFDANVFFTDIQVLVLTVNICHELLVTNRIQQHQINLLLIDKCHKLVTNDKLDSILKILRSCDNNNIKVIGFAVPLYNLTREPGELSFEIQRIESLLQCKIETASDLTSILRYSPKPKEYLLEYKIEERKKAEDDVREWTNSVISFLKDHRYDPTEIYDEEFLEDIKKIPNPTEKPFEMIEEFLHILETLGLWGADRAALIFLQLIEKLKIKTPYDRHYLLLVVVSTLFVKIRAYCDDIFGDLTDSEKIFKFSTPKVCRLIDVLKIFTPPNKSQTTVDSSQDISSAPVSEQINCDKFSKPYSKKPDAGFRKFRTFRYNRGLTDPNVLCGVVFVDNAVTAKVLFYLVNELSKCENDYRFLSPLYTSEKSTDNIVCGKDLEQEYRKQEEVLKKFRIHECNLLISTAILEEGIDIPKCNFVMRFDFPKSYQSYVQCKSRARASDALHVLLVPEGRSQEFKKQLAHYHYIEEILLSKCSSREAVEVEESKADVYDPLMVEYKPLGQDDAPKVSLNSAISLVNRYCAKLPSDTFTKLTAEWRLSKIELDLIGPSWICSLRLPINSPLKRPISSYPMPSRALARRTVALRVCVELHQCGELDEQLMPVGKENFRARPEDAEVPPLPGDELSDVRPGTTKRRQYYYKKVAKSLSDCKPEPGVPCYLYHVSMALSCPLPEEQNTRGRRIYPPEESDIGFGVLTSKPIPKVCPFPIYTRSGEVRVELKLSAKDVVLDEMQIEKSVSFLNYTFTNVLRLQKYLMMFDPNASDNSYVIVPVKRDSTTPANVIVDWDFLERIYVSRNSLPSHVPDEKRRSFKFDPDLYHDAVIMPWYRNQDQPQYFYVAEICEHLNPKSRFPGADYETFEEYYSKKYSIQIQNLEQPLLDVDHTSARLNFLTPRYVNRKGVALPTSSEETKRAKRENLEQKQILIAELCAIHPFPASLWRQAVCLPCILYRVNALLLADQIRCKVAAAINLGREELREDFEWPPLDFGWSLADVLKRTKEDKASKQETPPTPEIEAPPIKESNIELPPLEDPDIETIDTSKYNGINDDDDEMVDDSCEMEIGMWSNEMLNTAPGASDSGLQWGSNVLKNIDLIESSGCFIPADTPVTIERKSFTSPSSVQTNFEHEEYVRVVSDYFRQEISNRDANTFSSIHRKPIAPPPTDLEPFETGPPLFSFDYQPELEGHPGPSPSLILQALTMSNANDGINLERLETIGDSFLKYAITTYLFCTYERSHEGKLSHLRSKHVSNLNLYKLGKQKALGESMIATKFEPHDNWLPPCYYVPKELEQALIESGVPSAMWSQADIPPLVTTGPVDVDKLVRETEHKLEILKNELVSSCLDSERVSSFIPYNLITQHSIPDKSIADCVEALIGAYLIACGPRGALLFMSWLGIHVLPTEKVVLYQEKKPENMPSGSLPYEKSIDSDGKIMWTQLRYKQLPEPPSPLFLNVPNPYLELDLMLDGYDVLERSICYRFRNRSYLLQAFTHASYQPNRLTDCYQRLEFLGDAVLDYLITRHLYEDPRQHSPGALTDLRSALVNNTIFASLAVRCGFHKYFRHLSPGLNGVIDRFVRIQEENGHSISEEYYLLGEEEFEEAEDVEVPKALGDVFESLAGAIYLDSDMSLDAVWRVYHRIMQAEIELFSSHVPKSPIRELLELEPETAKFGRPEKLADGRRVRVTVDVFGKGSFKGIGRNYRIAKCTAAKCALKKLKRGQGNARARK
ncbi:hypothetical protein QAD02_006516 [Eretmocerus hayati]|uniref:Uncharacterized protein n=1 Tax=Eretmocerus hayati TaxID=131215 RepID=A0ACC2N146_9HYME|nr:hypothetical protein QAD02_006516 [Eretmocerus hayati]